MTQRRIVLDFAYLREIRAQKIMIRLQDLTRRVSLLVWEISGQDKGELYCIATSEGLT